MKISGKIWKFGDNIDAETIIPARYLNTCDEQALESPELWGLVENGTEVEVDADAGLIRIVGGADADPLKIPPVPPFMQQLIADGGLMNHIAKRRAT